MKRFRILGVALVALAALSLTGAAGKAETAPPDDWAIEATIIEACSCPMFCQCYFNAEPAEHHGGHGEGHFCRFNNAFRVSSGHWGDADLAGALVWVAGDLGDDFSDGKMDWAVLTFDPAVSEAQRAGIAAILGHVYPVEWNSFEIAADAEMEWSLGEAKAEARLAGGQVAEVVLNRMAGHDHNPVIQGLNYWGLPRNEGFVLMPNEVEAYRAGERAFEYGGGNGFTLTFSLSSEDVAAPAPAG